MPNRKWHASKLFLPLPISMKRTASKPFQLTEELAAAKDLVERLYARWHKLEEIKAGNRE